MLDSSLRALCAKQHLHLRATARSAVQVSQPQSKRDCFVAQNVLHLPSGLLLLRNLRRVESRLRLALAQA